jgi:hypothetical protein
VDQRNKQLIKQLRREAKAEHRAKKALAPPTADVPATNKINCACVIHGNGYQWEYVDKLHKMLQRHLSREVLLHVYTEAERPVPAHMVKHVLTEWPGVSGPKKSWWYKIQLFNPNFYSGPLLYLDLDTVIVKNIDWITQLNPRHFWSIRDFRHIWRDSFTGINSSMMWWDTKEYAWVWTHFLSQNLAAVMKRFPGDQDFISATIGIQKRRFFELGRVKSWRWQCFDGGFNFKTHRANSPGAGTHIDPNCSVLVFHGHPKPHETDDPTVRMHWT